MVSKPGGAGVAELTSNSAPWISSVGTAVRGIGSVGTGSPCRRAQTAGRALGCPQVPSAPSSSASTRS